MPKTNGVLRTNGAKANGTSKATAPIVRMVKRQKGKTAQPQKVVLFFLQTYAGGASITHTEVQQVSKVIAGLKIKPSQLSIDVVLSSPGGDPHAAYKMAKILRARASKVRFFIVYWAKSAATLLALSGDEILMGPDAELGPLDPQMEPFNLEGVGPMSALDVLQPLGYLMEQAQEHAFRTGRGIRNKFFLSRTDSLRLAVQHTDQLFAPIMGKFDPVAMGRGYRALQVTQTYAKDLLENYHFKGAGPECNASKVAETLVWHYPDHGSTIWRDEAKALHLRVKEAEKDPLWPFVKKAYLAKGGPVGTYIGVMKEVDFKSNHQPDEEQMREDASDVPA